MRFEDRQIYYLFSKWKKEDDVNSFPLGRLVKVERGYEGDVY